MDEASRAKCRAVEKAALRPSLVQSVCRICQTRRLAAADQTKCKSLEEIPAQYLSWESEIGEVIKKRDQWDDINAMANNEFQTSVSKTFGSLPPSDASLASYLQKRKNQGKSLSPADEKYLQACHQQCKPVTGFWPQNEKAIAEFVKGPWPFGDLPEKVCSLASYCRKRKQQGLPLTPAQERFFQHLVDLHQDDLNEGPTIRCVNFIE